MSLRSLTLKIIASIQARTSSGRLPGKVLALVNGQPLISWQVERLRRSRLIDDVFVATTTNPADDVIVQMCQQRGIPYYRGSENDVLQRVCDVVIHTSADVHVECLGDSPLVDPQIIDEFIGLLLKNKGLVDCVTSARRTTYPPGLEVTVYYSQAILKANRLVSVEDPLREHSALNLGRFPSEICTLDLCAPTEFEAPDVFLEVDTAEDLDVMREVFQEFIEAKGIFGLKEILDFAGENPTLFEKNRKVHRRWMQFRDK